MQHFRNLQSEEPVSGLLSVQPTVQQPTSAS